MGLSRIIYANLTTQIHPNILCNFPRIILNDSKRFLDNNCKIPHTRTQVSYQITDISFARKKKIQYSIVCSIASRQIKTELNFRDNRSHERYRYLATSSTQEFHPVLTVSYWSFQQVRLTHRMRQLIHITEFGRSLIAVPLKITLQCQLDFQVNV